MCSATYSGVAMRRRREGERGGEGGREGEREGGTETSDVQTEPTKRPLLSPSLSQPPLPSFPTAQPQKQRIAAIRPPAAALQTALEKQREEGRPECALELGCNFETPVKIQVVTWQWKPQHSGFSDSSSLPLSPFPCPANPLEGEAAAVDFSCAAHVRRRLGAVFKEEGERKRERERERDRGLLEKLLISLSLVSLRPLCLRAAAQDHSLVIPLCSALRAGRERALLL